ncbi:hypothetical protein LTR84_009769 [Exophiala bonariae]|uniref:Uncharacterized protein n=1 Tax=Exophiala bonariae TaxID=1690606 RepID=A0AAV9NJM1_9EURO|nr:hypothetical protein LTR84_009769 [Exophiala bonariae]
MASTEAQSVLERAHSTLDRARGLLGKRPAPDAAQLRQCVKECEDLFSPIDDADKKINKELSVLEPDGILRPDQNRARMQNELAYSDGGFKEDMRRLQQRQENPDDSMFRRGGGGGDSIREAMERLKGSHSNAHRSFMEREEYRGNRNPEAINLSQKATNLSDCRSKVKRTIEELNELL